MKGEHKKAKHNSNILVIPPWKLVSKILTHFFKCQHIYLNIRDDLIVSLVYLTSINACQKFILSSK